MHYFGIPFALQIKAVGFEEDGYFGRLDERRAAVAADLVLSWRLCLPPANGAFLVGAAAAAAAAKAANVSCVSIGCAHWPCRLNPPCMRQCAPWHAHAAECRCQLVERAGSWLRRRRPAAQPAAVRLQISVGCAAFDRRGSVVRRLLLCVQPNHSALPCHINAGGWQVPWPCSASWRE